MSRKRKRSPYRSYEVNLSKAQVDYLNGLLSAFEDFSDGAWQCACEDAIRVCGEFKGKDPFDVWMAWVKATANAK